MELNAARPPCFLKLGCSNEWICRFIRTLKYVPIHPIAYLPGSLMTHSVVCCFEAFTLMVVASMSIQYASGSHALPPITPFIGLTVLSSLTPTLTLTLSR